MGKEILKTVLSKHVNTVRGNPEGLSQLAVYRESGQSTCILVTMLEWKRSIDQ